jgi:hypothetical protein
MRARLILRYHECAEPREAHDKLNQTKIASNARLKSSEAQGGTSARTLATFSSSPDADCQEQLQWCSINLNFSSEKVFSKFAKQKIPRKSIAMDVAFQKVLLETMRSKLARVVALPG